MVRRLYGRSALIAVGRRKWPLLYLVWMGLFFLLAIAPSPGFAGKEETSDTSGPLLPFSITTNTDGAIEEREYITSERFVRDSGSADDILEGSGSGDITLTPSSTPTTPTTTSVSVYIEITLYISKAEYIKKEKEIIEGVSRVLREFLFNRRKREVSENEQYGITVELDKDISSNETSVLKAYVTDGVSGRPSESATSELYKTLSLRRRKFLMELEDAIEIRVVSVMISNEDPSVETPTLEGSSLRWWDILMIALGSTAAAACPLLLILAFCCRWFTRRSEEEEKEGLLTSRTDHLFDESPSSTVHTDQPRTASSVINTAAAADGLRERRDHVRRVARVGFQSRAQVPSHPLSPDEMENLLQNPATLHNEYSSIPSNLVTMADVPPGAEEKNRYKDILPNPQTRVSLFLKFAVSNSDYINANYIRGMPDSKRTFIATQGPLPWTVDDFWRMVWEQKTSIIVMVTGLQERRITKCAQYWPDQAAPTASYGDLNVTLKNRMTNNPHFTISQFLVSHREKLVSRDVTHFWFTAWPDHGVPTSTGPALEFLAAVQSQAQDIPAPIVVHCSAGIGRTGVFIGADMGMTQLESEGEVDVLKIVSTLRQDRGGMVQTEKQYVFLHQLLLSYARQLQQDSAHPPLPSNGAPNMTSSSVVGNSINSSGRDLVFQNNFTATM